MHSYSNTPPPNRHLNLLKLHTPSDTQRFIPILTSNDGWSDRWTDIHTHTDGQWDGRTERLDVPTDKHIHRERQADGQIDEGIQTEV